MEKCAVGFGPHLIMDLEGCPKETLQDLKLHFDYLNEVPERIDMHKITQPYVFPYAGLIPQDAGITGTIIIAESHLSVHSFEHKGFVFLDIFSCKPFDVEKAITEVVTRFKPSRYDHWVIQRGRHFPHTVDSPLEVITTVKKKSNRKKNTLIIPTLN